ELLDGPVGALARLEQARSVAFDGPDAEPLTRDALLALPPGDWQGLRLSRVPASRRIVVDFPAHELFAAVSRGEAVAVSPLRTGLAVWRVGRTTHVAHRVLDALETALLDVVDAGGTFADLCEAAAVTRSVAT